MTTATMTALVWPHRESEIREDMGFIHPKVGTVLPLTHAQIHEWYREGVVVLQGRRRRAVKP